MPHPKKTAMNPIVSDHPNAYHLAMGAGIGTRAAFVRHSTDDDEMVYVFGEIDSETDKDFRDALSAAALPGQRVVVDLTRCTYIGSQGFAALFDARSKMRIVVIAPQRIRRLMDLLALSDLVLEGA